MDIPPSGSKPPWNKESQELPEQALPEIPATPHLRPPQELSSEKQPTDTDLSTRQISRSPSTASSGPKHTWSNLEPLVRLSPDLDKSPSIPRGWRCNWNFQRKISELDLRPAIRKEAIHYIKLNTDERVRWLDERMSAQVYQGTDFPSLQGQMEVKANRDIKAFEILGHYAGEINTENSLASLKEAHGSLAVSEYLVEARQGYTVSALNHGNVCSLINANQLHVDKLDPNNPVVKSLDTTVVPANTALMPVSYQGMVITLVISIVPTLKGQSLWLDYGAGYWIDRFNKVPFQHQDDEQTGPDSLIDEFMLVDSTAEQDMDWLPDTVSEPESDSDDNFSSDDSSSSDDEPPSPKKIKLAGSRLRQLATEKSSQTHHLPLTPEQEATAVDQPFEEQNYQLKMRDNRPLLCNRHEIEAGQTLGTIKGRACYVTLLPNGKMVGFQDWYGKPVLMDDSEPVVLLGSLIHQPATPEEAPVYQGFILEGCHRFLTKSSTSYNCEVELFDPDNPEYEIESDDGSTPVYGKDFSLCLVSSQKLPAGTPLTRPAGLFPAFITDMIDSEEGAIPLKKACTHSMKSQLTKPLPVVWTQTNFSSLESFAKALTMADKETITLAKHLDDQPNDQLAITRLLKKAKTHPQLVTVFILASLKKYAPQTRDVLDSITRRLKRNNIPHPVTGKRQWVPADVFHLADTQGLIPRKMRYQYMLTQWLRNACKAGLWLELAGYCQHLLNSGCPSRIILSVLVQNAIPVPEFLEPKTEWNISNLTQFIKTFGVRIPAWALGQQEEWQSKRLSGNQGVIHTVLESIAADMSLADVRRKLSRRKIPVTLSGEKICPADVGELITLFKAEEAVPEDQKQRFFTWLDEQLFLTVQDKNSSAALNLLMKKRLNKDMLLHFIYAKARNGVSVRKLLDLLKRNHTPQPVEEGSSVIDNQWKDVGQYEFFEYLAIQGELGETTAREFYKSQTKLSKRKLAETYPWISRQEV